VEKQKIRTLSVDEKTWQTFKRITELEYGTHRRYMSEMFRRFIQDAWQTKYKYKDQLKK
jgi:hypothetical protein